MGEAKKRKLLGETGDFPRGKLNAEDEGGLRIGLAIRDRTVVIAFGKEVAWLGMSKPEAIAFGQAIIDKAKEIA